MKNFYILITTILLILFVTACSVNAQYATKNCIEVGGAVSYSSTTVVSEGSAASESTSFFQFMPYANYFISDGFSLGISPGINILKPAGSSSSYKNYALFFVPGYTFQSRSSVFPFLSAMVGYTALSSDGLDLSGVSFGGRAGIKVVVGNSGLATIGVSYIAFNLSPKGADKRSGYNNIALTLGYSVFIER
jgi:hypothetical protein